MSSRRNDEQADWRELRDNFDATGRLIRELRRLAADVGDDRDVQSDFEAETVVPCLAEQENRTRPFR